MLRDNDGQTSIKALLQGLIPDPEGVFQGTVISESPLKIQAMNDEKLIINAPLLIVPKHLTDYKLTVDITGGNVSGETDTVDAHAHTLENLSVLKGTLTIYNTLKKGEKVHLLSLNHGKKYYILDKVV